MSIAEITPRDLQARLTAKEEICLIDVRSPMEREICHIGGTLIPQETLLDRVADIPRDVPVVLYCRSGCRSHQAVAHLQERYGYTNLMNLVGGLLAWNKQVDSSITIY